MPRINPGRVALSPRIAGQRFYVERRVESVNSFGEAQDRVERFTGVGSITPDGENTLSQEDTFQYQPRTITVITRFRLRGPSKEGAAVTFEPDLVLWSGGRFQVVALEDFTQFGRGHVEAMCQSIAFNDQGAATL